MAIAELVLEYVKVLLSWPVIVGVISIVFLVRFKTPIAALIDRVASIRIPGGGEVLTPQSVMNVIADAKRLAGELPPSAEEPATPAAAAQGPAAVGENATEERVRSERERAALWEYQYLNQFLVPRTQLVMEWLANREPTAYGTYDTWWMNAVPDPGERSAIISALQNHHLIDVSRDRQHMIRVTDKGREYIDWRGPIAQFLARNLPPPMSRSAAALAGLRAATETPTPEPEPRPNPFMPPETG